MRRLFLPAFVVACALLGAAAHAAQVDGLQPPAWLQQAGKKQPLTPGMALSEADTVETGKHGKALIRLADGSFLRLGENARLELGRLQEEITPGGTIRGLLRIRQGAFRYTAGPISPNLHRELELQIATTTVGIRSTDVWARSRDGAATVCLIEGKLSVRHPARAEFVMDQPRSCFVAPAKDEPKPVGPVDPDQLKSWTAETELDLGQGVLLPGGGWIVELNSDTSEATARATEKRLLERGVPVERTTVQLRDRTFYRLRVSGFDTREDARAFAARLKGQPGTPKPSVTCNIPGSSCQ